MKIKCLCPLAFLLLPALGFSQGFKTVGADLKDADGNTFIMKGINVPLAWYQNDVPASIKHIKKQSGANTLRIVIGAGITPIDGKPDQNWNTSDVLWQATIDSCIKNKIIPMIEVHNVLGSNDSLDLKAVTNWWISKKDYLTRPDIAKYVLINIANEWGDWEMSQPSAVAPNQAYWRDAYIASVKALRAAGITTTLVIDAPGYGQDKAASALLTHAPAIINADPVKNLLFAIHTYCEWSTSGGANALTVFPQLKAAQIPFFVGEVANSHPNGTTTCQIPAEQIMAASVQFNSGYLAWSWKGNGGGTEALDLSVDWAGTQLTPWGELLVNSVVGTKTAAEASVFGGTSLNESPTVSITSPLNNASFQAPATITIEATAADKDGKVRRVDFYQGAVKIGSDTSAPYSYTWENAAKGAYTFTAFAVDNANGSGISNAVSVLVKSANGNILSNGDFETGIAGWELQTTAPGTGTVAAETTSPLAGTGSLKICPTDPGTQDYHVLAVTKASVVLGQTYELTFFAKGDLARVLKVGFQQNGGKWKWYTGSEFSLSTSSSLYSFSFVADTTDPAIDIKFMAGLSTACVTLDDVVFSSNVPTGLADAFAASGGALVYPNPFNETLSVQTSGNFRYEIRNQLGQLIETGEGAGKADIAKTVPKGLYILRVISPAATADVKIVKE